jgi:uncharacterized protein YkwD
VIDVSEVNAVHKIQKPTWPPYMYHQNVVLGGSFYSEHVRINFEREQRSLAPLLKRCRILDQMAKEHAEIMARKQAVFPSAKTVDVLKRQLGGCAKAGENVFRGFSTQELHYSSMQSDQVCTFNILSQNFTDFGDGTAKGSDVMIYMVQLFRGDGADIKESTQR